MKSILPKILLFMTIGFFLVQCSDNRDEYYESPSWAEPPLYDVLQQEGRFTSYLACVDRTLYASSLHGSGLFTCFAPNDDAFKSYLTANGYANVGDIPQSVVEQIVAYSLVYNSYKFERLSDVLSGGWDTLQSIKKRTPYYEPIYREWNGSDSIWVVDANGDGSFNASKPNSKYLPFYLARYFDSRTKPLTAADYNTFYPASQYTGRNVQNASILVADMIAGNGVAHEVDQVIEPLPNLERMLNNDNYSMFKNLVQSRTASGGYNFIQYLETSGINQYFQELYPSKNIDQVKIKFYGTSIQLNTESYGSIDKEAETNGFTLFAPNNAAVQKFFDEKLSDYYTSFDKVPADILYYFINAQMVKEMVWPGTYKGQMNAAGDYLNGAGSSGSDFDRSTFNDIKPASNGFFYGSSDYIKTRFFETVFTEILLNPNYSLWKHAFDKYFGSSLYEELLRSSMNGYSSANYIVLLPSDQLITNDGFTWEWITSAYGFSHSNTLVVADTRMQRLVRSHVFKRINNSDIDTRLQNLDGSPSLGYDGYGYAVNANGDMIRFKNGKIQMLGNYDENNWVTATFKKSFSNGTVYTIDKLLQYSRNTTLSTSVSGWEEQPMLTYIQHAAAENPNISIYNDYITELYTQTTLAFTLSTSSMYTILMPNNEAMQEAINAGVLPTIEESRESVANLQKVINFVMYHILPGKVYLNDGYNRVLLSTGETQAYDVSATMYKILITSTYLRTEKSGGNLVFKTQNSGSVNTSASVVKGVKRSNLFGAKAVLHEIDNYLQYIPEE
ncbi:fasciclin domain-containing protein [Dysgonomonas macrotermitis]|uniref:Uncaracterized surface protein containing fasciclin (FAS1) repeats n=1 Tax=Dysgonomonas macrotermitis TaxID=1346286 RepID=A0A1M4XB25_9BACT|nr:fasciclin domain-containing protein [Dysgonomonas macrotermitis]SHE90707.1 Uncaracterized surface protein containing fasciclin (FAS1) repeats [Dysgonomonas macrotermitis]